MKLESDKNYHFMPCLNEACHTYHLVSQSDIKEIEAGLNSIEVLLCDDCKSRQDRFHILQCLSCKTIIDFIPVLPGETASVVYVEKCLECGGTIEDEIEFVESLNKHLFI
jgi:hypothetical protein